MKYKNPIFITIYILSIINLIYSLLNLNIYLKIESIFLFIISISFFIKNTSINKITSLFIVLFIIFSIIQSSNILDKKNNIDFNNKNYIEIYNFAKDNDIKLKTYYEYSDNIKKDKIISYDIKENNKTISLIVSKGPNYEKKVIIPNMKKWNEEKIINYITDNNLINVNFSFVKEECNEKELISQNKIGTINRNEELNLNFCYKKDLKKFSLEDLTGKSNIEALYYLESNGIKVDIKESFNKVIPKNNIIKVNKSVGDILIPFKDKITLYVSLGNEIIVPDFKKMDKEEIYEWILKNNINANFKEIYDKKIKEGEFVKSNITKNTKIKEGENIIFYFSRGKLTLPNFSKINEFISWCKRNNIKYEIKYKESKTILEGEIIDFSIKSGSSVDESKKIIVYVSKEEKIIIPSFNNLSKEEIEKECFNKKILCEFSYQESSKKNNTYLYSTPSTGSKIKKGEKVIIILAKNKEKNISSNELDMFNIN